MACEDIWATLHQVFVQCMSLAHHCILLSQYDVFLGALKAQVASRNRIPTSQARIMPVSKDTRRAQRTVLAAGAAAAVVAGSTGSTFVAGPIARTVQTSAVQTGYAAAAPSAAPQAGSSATVAAGSFALAASAAALRSGARKSKKVATKATKVSAEAIL
jgi:hypothetical protein